MIRSVLRQSFPGTSRYTRATSVTSILSHHLALATATAAFSDLTSNVNSYFTVSPNSNPFGIKVRDFHAKSVQSEFRSSTVSPAGFAAQGYAPSYEGNDGGIGDSESVGSSGDELAISELGISPEIVKALTAKGIDKLFPIQVGESTSKIKGTKICIAIRSFDNPQKQAWSLPAHTRNVAMPDTRTLYTVLRSPHVDKKSREQFEMLFKKRFLVIKAESHELSKKLFWLKRYRILGAQYELQFHCKTRLDMTHVRDTINASTKAQ